jgi:hypothetical protein
MRRKRESLLGRAVKNLERVVRGGIMAHEMGLKIGRLLVEAVSLGRLAGLGITKN